MKTGAKITTEYTHVVDFYLTCKMFTLYMLFCASISIALELLYCVRSDVVDKKKVKVISSNK